MGKGSRFRPVDQKKYDRNYLRIFGEVCHNCKGDGEFIINNGQLHTVCRYCNGIGYIEKGKRNDNN